MIRQSKLVSVFLAVVFSLSTMQGGVLVANASSEQTLDIGSGSITIDGSTVKQNGSTVATDASGYVITDTAGTASSNTITVIRGTVNITLINVQISSTSDCAFDIKTDSAVTLTITGTNTLQSDDVYAGIRVPASTTTGVADASLTISADSTGSLIATGGHYGAGIGGDGNLSSDGTAKAESAGNVTIKGGTVTSNGGDYGGAGIGGGYGNSSSAFGTDGKGEANGGNGGSVNISGGTVTANGGNDGGAGIGGGYGYSCSGLGFADKANGGNGGSVNISGGTVTANGGDDGGTGIGGGHGYSSSGPGGTAGNVNGGNGSSVNISGGTVMANGSAYGGASIGGGLGEDGTNGTAGTNIFTGGSIYASSISGTPTNGSTNVNKGLYLTTVTLNSASGTAVKNTLIAALTTSAGYSYGTTDMKTDSNGNLYLWLPKNTATTLAKTSDGATPPAYAFYRGSVLTKDDGTGAGALVVNNPPATKSAPPAQSVAAKGTVSFKAADIAQDADGDTLTITGIVTLPDSSVATAGLSNGTVTLTGVAGGSTSVDVTVSDSVESVTITVPITVTQAVTSAASSTVTSAASSTVSSAVPSTVSSAASSSVKAPSVTGVAVLPAAASVKQGGAKTFSAVVKGQNSISQKVTWSVTGNKSAKTRISGTGRLTVGAYETASTLTVKATAVSDKSHSGIAKVTVVPVNPLTKAVAVKAKSKSYTSIQVRWNTVKHASAYEIYRSDSKNGTYTKVHTTKAKSYLDTALLTGSTYYYKVRARTALREDTFYSDFSAVRSAVPVPSAPGSFAVKTIGSKGILITYDKVAGADKYVIYRAASHQGKYYLIRITKWYAFMNKKFKVHQTRYCFKARAYRIVNGKIIYGPYTNIQSAYFN